MENRWGVKGGGLLYKKKVINREKWNYIALYNEEKYDSSYFQGSQISEFNFHIAYFYTHPNKYL